MDEMLAEQLLQKIIAKFGIPFVLRLIQDVCESEAEDWGTTWHFGGPARAWQKRALILQRAEERIRQVH